MKTIGYNHGRFQPLHNGHFNTYKEILKKFDELWIGIANPLRQLPYEFDKLDEEFKKSLRQAREPENNPYTFLERFEMIYSSLVDDGVDMKRVRILPHFGFYETANWKELIPINAVIVLCAKDYHHYAKVKIYKDNDWKVDFVDPLPGISGTIFDKAWPDGNWRGLVPSGTRKVLEKKF